MPQDTIFIPELKTNNLSISQQLHAHICAQIKAHNGKISFADFMQLALYAPGLGYYSAGSVKFGSQGDFITAPEMGTLFAQCIAVQCTQIFAVTKQNIILEIGAGSGQLACDLLNIFPSNHVQIDRYYILEVSADLKHRQQAKIQQQCPQMMNKVIWLDQLPATKISGVIIANEILDAMPCNIFTYNNNKLYEQYITLDQNNNLQFTQREPSTGLKDFFDMQEIALYLAQAPQPYTSEINLWIPGWIKSLAHVLDRGAILLFDYGFSRAEYYHPHRQLGTLMCHYQHRCHSDPFANLGSQDITAHVDFTAVAEAASANQLEVAGYNNLASFLLNCGITNYYQNNIRQAQEFNILTSAAEMGELFKAMILTKDVTEELVGFSHYDKTHTL